MRVIKRYLILLPFITASYAGSAQLTPSQDETTLTTKQLSFLSAKYCDNVSKKIKGVEQQLDKKTEKYLQKIKKRELRLYKKLWEKDSAKAKELFGDIAGRYNELGDKAREQAQGLSRFSKVYSSKLDSLTTAFKFLENNKLVNPELRDKLKTGLNSINSLQSKLDQTDQVRKFLKERKKLLTEQLEKFGMVKELKQFNKQVFYYQQQIKEYKQLLDDPSKLEEKLLGLLAELPAFKNFFANNSQLGSLFNLPGSASNSIASMAGLQTRTSVMQDLQSRFGSSQSVQQMLSQNMQSAQGQLNELKNKVNQFLPNGGSSDDEMPEGLKKNDQRTKSFWKKWETGVNIQSNKSNNILPVSSDIGLFAGFRPHNNFMAGIGFAGRIGWGKDLRHIDITYSGISARSFAELKLKGSFHAVAGFEMNYRSEFRRIDVLRDYNAWSESGLVGVSKVVSLRSKFFKKTKLQLLWDFLSYQQVPRTQALLFRIGYNF